MTFNDDTLNEMLLRVKTELSEGLGNFDTVARAVGTLEDKATAARDSVFRAFNSDSDRSDLAEVLTSDAHAVDRLSSELVDGNRKLKEYNTSIKEQQELAMAAAEALKQQLEAVESLARATVVVRPRVVPIPSAAPVGNGISDGFIPFAPVNLIDFNTQVANQPGFTGPGARETNQQVIGRFGNPSQPVQINLNVNGETVARAIIRDVDDQLGRAGENRS